MEKVLNATTPKDKLISTLTQPPPDIEEEDAALHPAPSVLDADHPMLAKFQRALKAHLLKVNAELQADIDELDHGIVQLTNEQEDCGARLYDALEEIERQKDTLDDYNGQLQEMSTKRVAHESRAGQLQRRFDADSRAFKELQRTHAESLMELQHLQVLENNIGKWTQEIDDEVRLARRIVSKDGKDQVAVAQQKRQMDMVLFNLDGEVKRNERQLAAVRELMAEQQQTLDGLNQSIHDANADVQALENEHRRLIGSWIDVILCVKQRDRILAQLRDDLFKEKQHQKVTDGNIEGTKKSAQKEMEQNEKLETFRCKLVSDLENMERQVDRETTESNKLQRRIDSMSALIAETEANQNKANVEGSIVDNQLKALRRSIERQNELKLKLEEKTLELLQDQITTDQASTYRGKMLRDVQDRRRQMELVMFNTEQQLSQAMLELERWKLTVAEDKAKIEKLTVRKKDATGNVSAMLQDVQATKNSINIKYKTFDLINRQLMVLIEAAGGQELDPSEAKVAALDKKNADFDVQIRDAQAFWLQLQGHVVSLTEKRSEQLSSIHLTRKQLLVIERKSLQIETSLDVLKKQGKDTRRNIKNLYTKMDALSAKLFERKRHHETEEVGCQQSHQELVNRLKDEELAVLQLNAECSARQRDIDEAKAATVEKHREALSWETKWKMAAETIRYRADQTAAASELGIMRAEIHRMEVRLGQLRRAQDKLALDMEHCVQHRDHIFDGASLRGKMPDGDAKTRYTVQHRLNDMKNKCKHAQNEMAALQRDLNEAYCTEQRFVVEIRMLEGMEEEERTQGQLLSDEIGQKQVLRQENLDNIVRVQNRARQYRSLLGKTLPKCCSESKLQADTERHTEMQQNLVEVLQSLLLQYPNHEWPIKRALTALQCDPVQAVSTTNVDGV